jgi:uncharacterized iron-regulated protein
MIFLSKKETTFPPIYVLIFIYSCTIIFGCATQEGKDQYSHPRVSKNKTMKFSNKQYRIYNSTGQAVSIDRIVCLIERVHVVFMGEMHNDPVAHYLQNVILQKTTDRYWKNANSSKRRQIVLSMEMFARDVQMILDEYLMNIINEYHFLSCVRPWHNYVQDYHPLVKYAKKNNLKVLAANAPRRYVHRVAQKGKPALNDLSTIAKTWIAPLPIKPPSEKMKKDFQALQDKDWQMKSAHKTISGRSHFLDAQNLWDATMAYSIHEELSNTPGALILHLNGYFHTMSGSGIPEHLIHYRPDVRMIVINIVRNDSFPKFHPQLKDSADFIIITDPKIRR